MEGRPIDTIGYRGMHSYEIAFDSWFVPASNLVGEADGLGKGFYLQMAGFENGRLQTAARAVGVMQAAYEAARAYADRPHGLRQADRRVPAHAGEARPHGGHDPGRPPVLVRRRPPHGQGRRHPRGGDGQGLRVQGRRVGDPRGAADPRRHGLRRGVRRQPLLRRRPRPVDLRRRRRDPLPQGHRPTPRRTVRSRRTGCTAASPCSYTQGARSRTWIRGRSARYVSSVVARLVAARAGRSRDRRRDGAGLGVTATTTSPPEDARRPLGRGADAGLATRRSIGSRVARRRSTRRSRGGRSVCAPRRDPRLVRLRDADAVEVLVAAVRTRSRASAASSRRVSRRRRTCGVDALPVDARWLPHVLRPGATMPGREFRHPYHERRMRQLDTTTPSVGGA